MEALVAATFGMTDDDDGQRYGLIVGHPPFFLPSHVDSFSVPISALVKIDLLHSLDSY